MIYDVIEVDLKPCPFCGEKVEMKRTIPVLWIKCDNCRFYMTQGYDDTHNIIHKRDELAARWNRRAE